VEFFSESEESHQVKSTCKSKNIQKQEEEILAPSSIFTAKKKKQKNSRVRFVFREQAKGTPSPFAFQNKKKAALSL
jgi:hypothetical protein